MRFFAQVGAGLSCFIGSLCYRAASGIAAARKKARSTGLVKRAWRHSRTAQASLTRPRVRLFAALNLLDECGVHCSIHHVFGGTARVYHRPIEKSNRGYVGGVGKLDRSQGSRYAEAAHDLKLRCRTLRSGTSTLHSWGRRALAPSRAGHENRNSPRVSLLTAITRARSRYMLCAKKHGRR